MVLVAGEAGIGKTSLINHFCNLNEAHAEIAVGACDGLFTPRPLGPLFDLARELGGPLHSLLRRDAGREELLHALLEQLEGSDDTHVLILEDIHWADDATLDLLRLLARRLHDTRTLVIVTFRDDELSATHPLRVMIGDLVTLPNVRRMTLPPLTEDAVRKLIGDSALDPAEVISVTGGNPFYVTEVLASRGLGVPTTVVDVVLARTARLSDEAREVLSIAALIGRRVESDLLEAIATPEQHSIEECLAGGVISAEGDLLVFRHELARRAIEGTLNPTAARMHHRSILEALEVRVGSDRDPARLAHHAELAGDVAAVLKYAPDAAAKAARMGAHSEAAEQYGRVLRFGDHLDASERARMLERRSYECYLTNQLREAVEARSAALDYWRLSADPLSEGDSLRWLSRLHWYLGQNAAAIEAAREAIHILEGLPPGRELAMAYSNQSQLGMLAQDVKGALHWGIKALELAERLGAKEIIVHALNNMGAAELRAGYERGRSKLMKSLAMATANGYEEHVARAYTNLARSSIHLREFTRAYRHLADGVRYCTEHDLDSQRWYMLSEKTRLLMDSGRWSEADDLSTAVLQNRAVQTPITRISALVTAGLLRVRRGAAGSAFLDEALELATGTGELQRLGPVRSARAEAAWLDGDNAGVYSEATAGYELARRFEDPWSRGQFAYWLWRAGHPVSLSNDVPAPYRLHIEGRLAEAAAAWADLESPYEAAVAGVESRRDGAMRQGFAQLDRLGAAATSRVLRAALRSQGVAGIPRGVRRDTRSNALGLTLRESEVLRLLEEGLTNAEIAGRLSVSAKTVGHHVSAILRKLSVSSRKAAATKSRELARESKPR
jgi:DNA-binding CsgD family transcriptional regulator/tetratricopeptide (TPR) repeat protein